MRIAIYICMVVLLALAAGCAPTPAAPAATTAAPTQAATVAYPAPDTAGVYPAPDVAAQDAYPGPVGAVPAAPNRSLITAEMIEERPDASRPNYTVLHVLLQDSQAAGGERDMLLGSVGEEIDLYVPQELSQELAPGQSFQAEVRVMGDENGQITVVQNFVAP